MEQYHPDRILIEPSGVGKLSDVIQAVGDVPRPAKCSCGCYGYRGRRHQVQDVYEELR